MSIGRVLDVTTTWNVKGLIHITTKWTKITEK